MSFSRRIWAGQPPAGAAADRSLGLSALFLPGQSTADFVSGLTLSSSVGTPTKSFGPFGPQIALNSSNESIYATALGSHKTSAYSMVWVGQFLGAPTAAATLAGLTYNSSNTSPYVLCELKRYNVGSNVTLTWNTSGTYVYLDSAALSAAGTFVIVGTVEPYNALLLIKDLSTGTIYRAYTSATSADLASTSTSRIEIGDSLNARNTNSACALFAVANRAWPEPVAKKILDNPWRLFRKKQPLVSLGFAASGTPTGTLATTNANDPVSASGSTTATGALAKTNASDSVSASGTTTPTGAFARTNANDSVYAAGFTGSTPTGALTTTNANDSISASGVAAAVGFSAYTNANDTSAAFGTTSSGGAADYGPAKKRFIQKVGNKIVVFNTASAALRALKAESEETPKQEAQESQQEQAAEPVEEVRIPEIKAVAKQYKQEAQLMSLFRQQDYEQILMLYESLMRQRDEDDIEVLLIAL